MLLGVVRFCVGFGVLLGVFDFVVAVLISFEVVVGTEGCVFLGA